MSKLKKLWARVPAPVKEQGVKVARVAGSAFVGTFVALVPGIYAAPDFGTQKALAIAAVVAACSAAFRAAVPAAAAAAKALFRRYIGA